MALTKDDVSHIAKLARLNLTEEELDKFTKQFKSIFKHLDALQEIDTTGVKPTSQVTDLQNVMRPDVPGARFERESMLATSKRPKERGMIKVRKSISRKEADGSAIEG